MNVDPHGPSPFASLVLLPSQLAALAALQPEQRLLFALLEASWNCLSKHSGRKSPRATRLVEQELEWVDSDERTPFSFRFCCEHLDMEPEALRAGIHRTLDRLRAGGKGEGVRSRVRREQNRGQKLKPGHIYKAASRLSFA
jgi:hypothetical protein